MLPPADVGFESNFAGGIEEEANLVGAGTRVGEPRASRRAVCTKVSNTVAISNSSELLVVLPGASSRVRLVRMSSARASAGA